MSKRILVIEHCTACPHHVYTTNGGRLGDGCSYEGIESEPFGEIPDNCPLAPMPERWTPETEDYSRCADVEYYAGWNECLDEIEGGGENG